MKPIKLNIKQRSLKVNFKYSPSSFWNTNNIRRERLERHRIKRTVLVQIF